MIDCIRLKNLKGIKTVNLKGLSHTNILCGKNSSGKSSILEAISKNENCAVGFEPKIEIFSKYAAKQTSGYSSPPPFQTQGAMESIFKSYILQKTIFYPDEKDKVITDYINLVKKDAILAPYITGNTFKYDQILNQFFAESDNQYFKAILVPPKRQIATKCAFNQQEDLKTDGTGILNRLFILKNQSIDSLEFKTYMRIYSSFNKITGCNFNISIGSNFTLNLLFQIGKNWLDAENCGLGLRDVLILVVIILSTEGNFFLIEEPENHLHADFQKRLLHFINEDNKDKQFLLSTHSNIFIDIHNTDKIYYCWFDKEVNVSDETSHSKIISSLGYSVTDNLTSDAIILTEGKSDFPVIRQILKWVGLYEKYNIKLWSLHGDDMADFDLSIFKNAKCVFAIIDTDSKSDAIRKKFIENCKNHGINCYKLKRYAIENYFTTDAISRVFGEQINKSIKLKEDKSVDEQIGFKAKEKSIKGKNFEIIENMTLDDLTGTDLLDAVNDIKTKIEAHYAKKETEIAS